MSGCGRTLFWIGFTERTISNLKHSTHNIYSKLSTLVVPRPNGPCQEKNRLFYDFLPGSTTFVLWRTAKTWMQPSTKTKDTFEPSNETVSDEKTAHGRKQMYKWECQAAGRAFFCTTSQALRASADGEGHLTFSFSHSPQCSRPRPAVPDGGGIPRRWWQSGGQLSARRGRWARLRRTPAR